VFQPWTMAAEVDHNDRWTVAELDSAMQKVLS
jgi:predicted nuclease of restriction endonuclease-like RecB superfamily